MTRGPATSARPLGQDDGRAEPADDDGDGDSIRPQQRNAADDPQPGPPSLQGASDHASLLEPARIAASTAGPPPGRPPASPPGASRRRDRRPGRGPRRRTSGSAADGRPALVSDGPVAARRRRGFRSGRQVCRVIGPDVIDGPPTGGESEGKPASSPGVAYHGRGRSAASRGPGCGAWGTPGSTPARGSTRSGRHSRARIGPGPAGARVRGGPRGRGRATPSP